MHKYLLWLALAACGCARSASTSAADAAMTPSPAQAHRADPGSVAAGQLTRLSTSSTRPVCTGSKSKSRRPISRASIRIPKSEEYVPARLHFEGKTYDVGYRYKGSVGGFRPPCTAEFDGGPKAGKCSIKLSLNWPHPDGEFFGLKKLLFHAMIKDESQLRERLGYSLFRTMGVPAPRAVHAVLSVNGQAELYALVEEVDGRFTRSRFTEGGEGNLYKEIWPVHDDPNAYSAALETNEDEAPSVDRMLRFKSAVAAGVHKMAEWMDVDLTVDSYCIDGGMGNNPTLPGNHNYFWYEAKQADRMC